MDMGVSAIRSSRRYLQMDSLLEMLPLLVPILVLDAALAVAAVLHVLRHPHYRFGSRAFWLAVVVVALLIGPITYFVVGRGEEP